MQIFGTPNVHGPQNVKGPQGSRPASGDRPAAPSQQADSVDISPAASAAANAADGEIRADLVARVKNEIAAGTYETPEKLDTALDNFLNELA
ncbi:MAG: flagellar biosynthesis anti-sigma factor FlgM [Lacipirellulaceae bacterium]